MIDKRAPYPGDVLLDPPRMVTWVNVDRREFRCRSLDAMPGEWAQAPIEDGWRDVTRRIVPEDVTKPTDQIAELLAEAQADLEAGRFGPVTPGVDAPQLLRERDEARAEVESLSAAFDASHERELALEARLAAAEALLERWRAAVKTSHPDIWSDTDLFLGS